MSQILVGQLGLSTVEAEPQADSQMFNIFFLLTIRMSENNKTQNGQDTPSICEFECTGRKLGFNKQDSTNFAWLALLLNKLTWELSGYYLLTTVNSQARLQEPADF